MAVFLAFLLVFLAMAGYSNAAYCLCNGDFQKNIDYACGNGADCSPILQNGNCYNPNTVRDHCSYAVNSYYQRKSSTGATCDFSGTATLSQTAPSATSGCNYPSSASNAGTSTPTNPSIAPPGSSITTPTGGTGGSSFNGGLGPSGLGPDNSNADGLRLYQGGGLLLSLAFIFFVSGLNGFRA